MNQYKNIEDENVNNSIEINYKRKEELELERSKNRQSYIYYNLDRLKRERNEMQPQISCRSVSISGQP